MSALRHFSMEVRATLHHNPDGLRLLWDKLLAEYLHKQQERSLKLIESVEEVLSQRGDVTSSQGADKHRGDSLNTLNALTIQSLGEESQEYRMTYCGLGPHLLARNIRQNTQSTVEIVSGTPASARVVHRDRSITSSTGGRVVVGSKYLEPRVQLEGKLSRDQSPNGEHRPSGSKSPIPLRGRYMSLSPEKTLQRTPQVWNLLSEDERTIVRDRENYAGPLDGGYAELSRRYDEILDRYVQSGSKSVKSDRSRSMSPLRSSTIKASSMKGSPTGRKSDEFMTKSLEEAPWSAYSSRKSLSPAQSTGRETTPKAATVRSSGNSDNTGIDRSLERTPFNSSVASATHMEGEVIQFSPASLPPQQQEPDSEPSRKSSEMYGKLNNEELLSHLLWGNEAEQDSSESNDIGSHPEIVEQVDEGVGRFDPTQQVVLDFLASLRLSTEEGDVQESEGKKDKVVGKYAIAQSVFNECSVVWDVDLLKQIMYNALRSVPLGPHPSAARGSWERQNGSRSVTPTSQRNVSPNRSRVSGQMTPATAGSCPKGAGTPCGGDTMKSLKAQYDSTSRVFGRIYEDIMATMMRNKCLSKMLKT